jgi:hypothetical protein
MVERSRNPADVVGYYSRLILEEQRNIQESFAKIAEYASALQRVGEDTSRRLLPKE